MTQEQAQHSRPAPIDFEQIFDLMPSRCLVLDTAFNIPARNAEHAKATLSVGEDGFVRSIINRAQDVTNIVRRRRRWAASFREIVATPLRDKANPLNSV